VRRIAILAYHKVGPPSPGAWETWFSVPAVTFAEQLEALYASGWETVDVGTFLRGLRDPVALPERAAVITLDDGYRSALEFALPALRRFGSRAVMFVPSGFVGRTNAFDEDDEPQEPLCGWDELRELVGGGVSVQSHGVTHRRFSELTPADRQIELERSKAELEAGLGEPVRLFAYPYGDDAGAPPELRKALARAGYVAACGYGGGPFRATAADPYRLERVAMGPDTDLAAALACGADD